MSRCVIVLAVLALAAANAEPRVLKVSPQGPLTTLEAARDAIRALKATGWPAGGVTVEIAAGTYELARPLVLEAKDSGTAEAPITYRAVGRVRLVGGKMVSGWRPVTDQAVLQQLDPAARGHVLVADLKAQGLTDYGQVKPGPRWAWSEPGLELFFGDRPMTIARWPNEGFVKIAAVNGPTAVDIRGTKGCAEGIFTYDGDRPARWVGAKDVMLHGYWFWDWADQRLKVQSIDPATKRITLEAKPVHPYGFRTGQWYYAYNLLCELDQPGEWYLDRDQGQLYFWPPAPITSGEAAVSVAPNLITCQNVSDVTFRGLVIEACRGDAVTVSGGRRVTLAGCTVRNVGGWGVRCSGTAHRVVGCDIYQVGDGGISLSGGDRKTLTPGGLVAENNDIHHFGRWNPIIQAGIQLDGVGQRVAHNLLHDAPHIAVLFGGNDHVVEYNEMHNVVERANDAGVMYAGYNPTMRGHIIRYNYIHHVYGFEGKGCNGVYLDDMFCSATIYGNVFYQVPRAAFVGGGRDNLIENNLFVDCDPAIHVDARALGWAKDGVKTLIARLKEVPYNQEPYRSRWPQLLTYEADEPAVPKGNVFRRNISWLGHWDTSIEAKARPHVKFEDNLVGEDPKLFNLERLDFRLREDSPAWRLGFQRIPVEKIGVYRDELRASWPVKHPWRPGPPRPAPSATPKAGAPPLARVAKVTTAPNVDGAFNPAAWVAKGQELVLALSPTGVKQAPTSRAWLAWDDQALYLALRNDVDPKQPLRRGPTWGQDDAVELALRDPATKTAPILLLRGYPNGHCESSDEAGAPAAAVTRATQGVTYRAAMADGLWTCQWRIPWAALGYTPRAGLRLQANLSVRKTAGDQWLMWAATQAHTWEVERGGVFELLP